MKKYNLLIVFIILVFTGCTVKYKVSAFDKELIQVASEMNKHLPIMVDAETRLDNVMALPGRVFEYNYTLINFKKSEIDLGEFIMILKPKTINMVRTSPDVKPFRDNNVILQYNYYDKNSVFLTKIIITPNMYK